MPILCAAAAPSQAAERVRASCVCLQFVVLVFLKTRTPTLLLLLLNYMRLFRLLRLIRFMGVSLLVLRPFLPHHVSHAQHQSDLHCIHDRLSLALCVSQWFISWFAVTSNHLYAVVLLQHP